MPTLVLTDCISPDNIDALFVYVTIQSAAFAAGFLEKFNRCQ